MSIVDRYRWGTRVLLAALICAVLAGSGFDSTVSAQSVIDYDADDDGLIEVTTEAQLNAIRWDMDGNGVVDASANATSYSAAFPTAAPQMGCPSAACAGYELAADISLTSSSGMGWEPIGNSATRFNATFEGNAHTISNLFINRTFVNTTADNMGLFGATGSASAIRNVKLTSVDVTGNDNVGALAGDNKGQIENCEATGTVTGRLDVGGLVGENYGPITGSSASGTVTSFYLVGGLVGLTYGSISTSRASADVTATRTDGSSFAGGLVGWNVNSLISNSHASGNVTGSDTVGGLVGSNKGPISGSTASGIVTTTGDYVGGLVGGNNGTISDSAALNPSVTGAEYVGGLVGRHSEVGTIERSIATANVIGTQRVGGLVGLSLGPISHSYASGDVHGTGKVGGLVGGNTGSISGSTASGTVTTTGNEVGGLVGWNNGPISDSDALNPSVTGVSYVGGLVGQNDGADGAAGSNAISGSTASGTVTATGSFAGGLVGSNEGPISDSDALNPSVTGVNWVGGLVGFNANAWPISGSTARGPVTASGSPAGGLVGQNTGPISGSSATGTVTGRTWVGGLVGLNNGPISGSSASGEVTATRTDGASRAGGLVGENRSTPISNSHASGDVTGSHDMVGGLVGHNLDELASTSSTPPRNAISGSTASGTVTTTGNEVGGLVGWNNGPISDSDALNPSVTGEDYVGGLVGRNIAPISGSTARGAVTATASSAQSGTAGGLVGWNDGPISDSAALNPSVTGVYQAGGLVGWNTAPISGSTARGAVTATGRAAGGLVGRNTAGIAGSVATGSVTGPWAGGLVGYSVVGSISRSAATGAVSGGILVGGLVAYISAGSITESWASGAVSATSQGAVGGLVGSSEVSTVSASFATGNVTASFATGYAGGLIGGNSGAVHASYATGNVTVSDDTSCVGASCPRGAGGLIGFAGDTSRVTSGSRVSNVQASYSTGMVSKMSGSSTYSLGGLAGIGERDADVPANNAVFTNSYWDNETSGQTLGVGSDDADANGTIDGTETATAGVTGQTTSALKAPTGYTGIFANWNVTITGVTARTGGPWNFGAATDYPVLRGLGAPPAFPAGTALLSVAEEGAANTPIGFPLTATATVGDALSYKLVGAGAVFFSIDPATGQVSTTTRLDYENPSDADRDNTYASSATYTPVQEDVGRYLRATVTYIDSQSGGKSADMTSASAVAANPPPEFSELMVQASDGMTVAFRTVAINVPNLDEAGAVDLPPGRPVVGKSLTATLSDPDGGVTIPTWTWAWSTSSSGSFTPISSASSATYTPVPADEGRYLKASVSYTDGQGSGKTAEMTSANAVAANPAPVFDPTSVTFAVDENATTGTAVGTVTATDIDNNRIIYSVGGAGAVAFNQDFSLDSASGAITVGAPIDHENKASYAVTITATDPFESAGTISVTINVTNVDEAGTVTLPVDDPVMGRPVTATLRDPDGEVTSQIWTWAWSTSSTGGFSTISGASSATYTPVLGDVGRWLKARVSYSDFQGSGKTAEMTSADAVAANPPPVFDPTSVTFAVDENATTGTAVGTVTATDPDGEAVTYSVSVGGADVTAFNEDFSLGSSSGAITVKTGATIDHESKASYAVTITATDIVGITATAGVTINVTDVDEAGAVALTADTPAVGKPLTAILSDPDGGVTSPTWTWASSTTRTGSFTTISSASSATYTPVQGDVARFLKASVSYTDSFGAGKTAEMTSVKAVSANPPPVFANSSPTFTVDENASSGAVGTVTATDPESEAVTYSVSVVGADVTAFNEDFSLGSTSGAITVKSGATIDHERKSSYAVTITATDTASVTATAAVTINVTDVDEAGTVDLMPDTLEVGKQLTATLSDPDGGVTSPTWTWASSTTRTGNFRTLNGANSASYTVGPGDVARFLKASVSYTDSFGSGKTAEMTSANAAAASPPPVFGDASVTFTVDEKRHHGTGGHGHGHRPRYRRHHLFRGRRRRAGVQRRLQPRLRQRDDQSQARRHDRPREQALVLGNDHGH